MCKDPVAASTFYFILGPFDFLTSYFVIRHECRTVDDAR